MLLTWEKFNDFVLFSDVAYVHHVFILVMNPNTKNRHGNSFKKSKNRRSYFIYDREELTEK